MAGMVLYNKTYFNYKQLLVNNKYKIVISSRRCALKYVEKLIKDKNKCLK